MVEQTPSERQMFGVDPWGRPMLYNPDGTPMRTFAEYEAAMEQKRVALTRFPSGNYVSTVFLIHDHGFNPQSPPVLWETMVFAPNVEDEHGIDWAGEYQRRYTSREDALAGHAEVVAEVGVELDEVPMDLDDWDDDQKRP